MTAVAARPVVTLDVARAVLHWAGDSNYGIDPGHFWNRQYAAFSAADAAHLEQLRTIFPAEVYAWEAVARKPWGLGWLIGVVKAHLDGVEVGLDFGSLK